MYDNNDDFFDGLSNNKIDMKIFERREKLLQFLNDLFPQFDDYKEKLCIRTIHEVNKKDANGKNIKDKDGNYVKIKISKNHFFTNKSDVVEFVLQVLKKKEEDRSYMNMFISLSTIKISSNDTKEDDLYRRQCLVFDFDILKDEQFKSKVEELRKQGLKDEEIIDWIRENDIYYRFKNLGLFYHIIINSGNGLHYYVLLDEPCDDIKKLQELNKKLVKMLNSDENANKVTQIMRIPYSYNNKNKNKKLVYIRYRDYAIKRKSLEELNNRFNLTRNIPYKRSYLSVNDFSHLPICLRNELENGTMEGKRYETLCDLVVYYRNKGMEIDEIKLILNSWATKSNYKLDDKELENIYKNKKYITTITKDKCKYCNCKANCSFFTKIEIVEENDLEPNSHINYSNEYSTINIDSSVIMKSIKGEDKPMSGNELFILSIMLNYYKNMEYVKRSKLIEHITYKGNRVLSDKTFRETLKSLLDKEYIECKKGNARRKIEDEFRLTLKSLQINKGIKLSYFPTLICKYGNITTNQLKLYYILRYQYNNIYWNENERKENKLQKGYICISYERLSELYYGKKTGKKEIGNMIEKLVEEELLYRKPIACKDNPNRFYYIYKLNC